MTCLACAKVSRTVVLAALLVWQPAPAAVAAGKPAASVEATGAADPAPLVSMVSIDLDLGALQPQAFGDTDD